MKYRSRSEAKRRMTEEIAQLETVADVDHQLNIVEQLLAHVQGSILAPPDEFKPDKIRRAAHNRRITIDRLTDELRMLQVRREELSAREDERRLETATKAGSDMEAKFTAAGLRARRAVLELQHAIGEMELLVTESAGAYRASRKLRVEGAVPWLGCRSFGSEMHSHLMRLAKRVLKLGGGAKGRPSGVEPKEIDIRLLGDEHPEDHASDADMAGGHHSAMGERS